MSANKIKKIAKAVQEINKQFALNEIRSEKYNESYDHFRYDTSNTKVNHTTTSLCNPCQSYDYFAYQKTWSHTTTFDMTLPRAYFDKIK